MPEKQYKKELQIVLDKECLCVGLSNSAAIKYEQTFLRNLPAVTICPGPNIAYFSQSVSLLEMTNHIYGRTNIITDKSRPHVFINELFIYINYLKEQLSEADEPIDKKKLKYFNDFYNQLLTGINYYRRIIKISNGFPEKDIENFKKNLDKAELGLQSFSEIITGLNNLYSGPTF